MKFDLLIECNKKNIFLQKLCRTWGWRLLFCFFGLFIWRWGGPVRRASSPRWDHFYFTFIWYLLSQFNLACHLNVTHIWTRMSFLCHLYVFVWHSYVACMYSMSFVCHSYVTRIITIVIRAVSYDYDITHMCFYHAP